MDERTLPTCLVRTLSAGQGRQAADQHHCEFLFQPFNDAVLAMLLLMQPHAKDLGLHYCTQCYLCSVVMFLSSVVPPLSVPRASGSPPRLARLLVLSWEHYKPMYPLALHGLPPRGRNQVLGQMNQGHLA